MHNTPTKIARSAWISLIAGGLCVVAGVVLFIAGMPDETATQALLMEAASIPFVLAVAIPVTQMTIESRTLHNAPRPVWWVYGIAAGFLFTGIICYVIGFSSGPRSLITTGSTLCFAGLGIVFCYLAYRAMRRERQRNRPTIQFIDSEDDEQE